MPKPSDYAKYVGFTENEVQELCERNNLPFAEMKKWYDGYHLRDAGSVYNPNSVMKAIRYRDFDSYWTESSAADSLLQYIRHDASGLRRSIASLIGGISLKVDTKGFSNDLVTFHGADDILTLLIHLGYLAYDENSKEVCIPNEEIRREFIRTIHEDKSPETMKRVQESTRLIMDTVHMNEKAVADQIEIIHMESTNPLNANNEHALRAVIQLAYFSYRDYYLKMEELPAGHGYANIVYLSKPETVLPTLIVELKWNESADTAIAQIKTRKYPAILQGFDSDILLVGISYDKEAQAGNRRYTCRIEKWNV